MPAPPRFRRIHLQLPFDGLRVLELELPLKTLGGPSGPPEEFGYSIFQCVDAQFEAGRTTIIGSRIFPMACDWRSTLVRPSTNWEAGMFERAPFGEEVTEAAPPSLVELLRALAGPGAQLCSSTGRVLSNTYKRCVVNNINGRIPHSAFYQRVGVDSLLTTGWSYDGELLFLFGSDTDTCSGIGCFWLTHCVAPEFEEPGLGDPNFSMPFTCESVVDLKSPLTQWDQVNFEQYIDSL